MRRQVINTLILGASSTFLTLTSKHIPYINAFLLGLGLLALQTLANTLIITNKWPNRFSPIYRNLAAYTATSLFLLPTYILCGSAVGILQTPQDIVLTLPLASGLFMISVYFYLLISHSLRWHLEGKVSLARAIDLVAGASLRNYRLYFNVSFYFGILMVISVWTWGAGLLFTLPFLFYCDHFLFTDMKQNKLIEPALP